MIKAIQQAAFEKGSSVTFFFISILTYYSKLESHCLTKPKDYVKSKVKLRMSADVGIIGIQNIV